MTILVNGNNGSESQYSYCVRFNIANGNVEFVAHGSSVGYTNTLIQLPYLERWYHLALVQQGATFTGYVDGRQVFSSSGNVGNTANTNGVSIGGWGNGQYLYGEVQEVSIYQNALSQDFIVQYMFDEQPTNDSTLGLVGYFPIGYSTNASDEMANFAPPPVPSGTASASQQGNGAVTFEQTDEGGEQSAFDANRNGGRGALVPLSGAFTWQQSAFSRPTPGIAFDFRFGYSSANAFGGFQLGSLNPYSSGPMGGGWRHTFETCVIPAQDFSPISDADTVGLMRWDGSIVTWDLDYGTGEYVTRNGEYSGELVITTTNCQWTTPERLVYIFNRPDAGQNLVMRGRLTAIRDFNGNAVQILWNQVSGVITQVVDTAGGQYSFNYQRNLLTNVTFGSWAINFGYNSTNQLTSKSITNSSGVYTNVNTSWQFLYGTNGLLASVIDPRSTTNITVQYDQYGRRTNEVDAIGRVTQTAYEIPGMLQITHIDPGTESWVESYDRKGNIVAQTDPLQNTTSYTYDTNGNRTSITEPLGWTTLFGYDSRANVTARTNALGEVSQWVFHPFFNKAVQAITPQPSDANGWTTWTNFYDLDNTTGNLLAHHDAIGTLVSYTYTNNGLVASSTDGNGNATRFFYDTNGFLIKKTDPAGNSWTYANNDVGWRLSEENPLGQLTSFNYDLNGNVVLMVDPLQRNFTKTYDANGNVLTQSDGKGQLTRYAYDAANQKTNLVDRTGTNTWTFTYTLRGKPERSIDPLGNTVTNFYDSANRLASVSDPLGYTVTDLYDANGNVTNVIDKLGQPWSKTYDRLNRVIAEADPLGDTKRTLFDVAGRIQQIITPNGYPSTHSYDGRGRLVKWVDPMNSQWLYAYDGVGNITNITDALGGYYVMVYSNRNERVLEQNQDNKVWLYTCDALLRLGRQTDPNGTTRNLIYDAGNRVLEIDFSTGRVDAFDYDNNNNPIVLSRSGSGPATLSQLSYDAMDRVSGYLDAFGKQIGYTYDALGRITTLTYPYGKALTQRYDALGRLTNQVDWAGRQMIYTYDKANRLISRVYPNGVTQTNTFDNANRITSLSHETLNPQGLTNAIAIALTYAYDRNGNKTGATEKGTLNWPMPTLTDKSASYTASGRLISRQISTNSSLQSSISYSYDPSGNMTNAAGNGQTWALTYDEDNRVTSVFWDCPPLTSKSIVNRYDALGRRVARTVNGAETDYVLDLSGDMERILCDLNPDATVNYYVHGPNLCYRVDATNGLTCYHADAMGNVIALTDGDTNTIAQYAYTPYGRSLGSTNFPPSTLNYQPYTFVGSQGVMEEDVPNLYFMRARYYSAEAGTFLSTDQVKNIGPGWKPVAYVYAHDNPISRADPSGLLALSQVTGALNFVGEFSPVNLGVLLGSEIGYGVGYLEGNAPLMNHTRSGIEIPFQNTVSDLEQVTQSKISVRIEGVDFNDTMAISHFRDDRQMYRNVQNLIDYGNYANAALDVGEFAQTGIQASTALSNGEWDQVGGYITSALLREAGHVGLDIPDFISAAKTASTLNPFQAKLGSPASNQSGNTSGKSISSSANTSFSKTVQSISNTASKASNSITQTVKNAASAAKQSISNVVKSVTRAISKIF